MWVNVIDEVIPTDGKHGYIFQLYLYYQNYYGHNITVNSEVVTAYWDAEDECFYDTKMLKQIDSRDIAEWWKDI